MGEFIQLGRFKTQLKHGSIILMSGHVGFVLQSILSRCNDGRGEKEANGPVDSGFFRGRFVEDLVESF